MDIEGIIFIVLMCLTRIAGLVCGTILVLNNHIWEGLALGLVPFLAGGKYTGKDEVSKQNI